MLRHYQNDAVQAVYQHLQERNDNPVVVLPTGAGKSWVIAQLAADVSLRWNGRVLVLAHRRELLEQNADKLRQLNGQLKIGLFSAGLRRKDSTHPVIFAGIQSIWKKACDFPPFDIVIIDECHLINPDEEGMYRRFLADLRVINPQLRVIGLTATPYRLKTGRICSPDGFLNQICYEVGVRELIVQGYLSPLITKAGREKVDTSGVQVRGGEFVAGLLESLMDEPQLVEAACRETMQQTRDRKSVLIFASGVRHGQHVAQRLKTEHGVECGFVTGETPSGERDRLLERFKSGDLRFLCNVNVLTTGFDAPNVDCVVLLRPTMSPGLYYQMVGRGFRLAPGKQNCLVLDFGGNVLRHGPVDAIQIEKREAAGGEAPLKECPICQSMILAGYATCPHCGYTFPPPDKQKHEAQATEASILSAGANDEQYEVLDIFYRVHRKKDAGPDAPKSMRVDYQLGLNHWQSEFICFEHTGYARQKAEAWWQQRSPDPVPDTAEAAVTLANAGALRVTHAITVRSVPGERFDRIVKYDLGSAPEGRLEESIVSTVPDDDEVPF
ncbi:MAG: DEAD/DEAH box helicase family protein [Planctomycetaceae bacterium]|nr:DEAD/DEAH box helicase family protein [Planctomycetaceae bacterium]